MATATKIVKLAHTKRLRKLANILKRFKGEDGKKFDMGTWGTHPGDTDHAPDTDNFCGTSACALGHAAMDPQFRKAGLKLRWRREGKWNDARTHYDENFGPWQANIDYKGSEGEYAGGRFFGLSDSEAEWVFLGMNATKDEVVAKLRALAKKRCELNNTPYEEYNDVSEVAAFHQIAEEG